MKKNNVILLLTLLLTIKVSYGKKCDQTGLQIMELQKQKQSLQSEEESQHIIIQNLKTNAKEPRKLKRYMLKNDKGKRSLLYFTSPKEINGAALLSWNKDNSENQWLYMPALKKLQKIASGSKKNYFMGTDFTYGDLDGEKLEDNHYKCLGVKKCSKAKCYVIAALPKSRKIARNMGYARRVHLVNAKRYTTEQTIYYDLKKKKLKMATFKKWQQINDIWRPTLAVMERFNEQKTFIKIIDRKINTKVSKQYFQKRYVQKERHMN